MGALICNTLCASGPVKLVAALRRIASAAAAAAAAAEARRAPAARQLAVA
jgi:phosphoribosyl-dephospho-CoA transferase